MSWLGAWHPAWTPLRPSGRYSDPGARQWKLSQDDAHCRHSALLEHLLGPWGLEGKQGHPPAWGALTGGEGDMKGGRWGSWAQEDGLAVSLGRAGCQRGLPKEPAEPWSQGAFFVPLFSDVERKPQGGRAERGRKGVEDLQSR